MAKGLAAKNFSSVLGGASRRDPLQRTFLDAMPLEDKPVKESSTGMGVGIGVGETLGVGEALALGSVTLVSLAAVAAVADEVVDPAVVCV